MLTASCHCGAVVLELSRQPEYLVNCNCSICRRYAALWSFYAPSELRIHGHPQHTTAYVWGKRSIRTLRCSHCGCVTHWEEIVASSAPRCGVNLRNVDPNVWRDLPVRYFDGADSWRYVDAF